MYYILYSYRKAGGESVTAKIHLQYYKYLLKRSTYRWICPV